ncbi:MAG: zinc-binding dehydrogenase, partial [Pseudomonadota bacterium]
DTPLLGQRVSFFGSGTGVWAEYALTDISGLIPLRPDISDDDAAGLIVNPLTAMAMFEIVRRDGAESFVATAAGSQLGKYLISLGRDGGIGAVAVVRRAALDAPLRALGAADVLVTEAEDFDARSQDSLKTHQPRILLDAVGDQTSSDLFFAMPKRARWISYGRLSTTPPQLGLMGQFIFMEKRIEGFWLTAWFRDTAKEEIARVVGAAQARFAEGRWKTEITETVPLANAMRALPAAYSAKDGKVLIAP